MNKNWTDPQTKKIYIAKGNKSECDLCALNGGGETDEESLCMENYAPCNGTCYFVDLNL